MQTMHQKSVGPKLQCQILAHIARNRIVLKELSNRLAVMRFRNVFSANLTREPSQMLADLVEERLKVGPLQFNPERFGGVLGGLPIVFDVGSKHLFFLSYGDL